jgi:hypothetical protein
MGGSSYVGGKSFRSKKKTGWGENEVPKIYIEIKGGKKLGSGQGENKVAKKI